jgi:arogenate dehydrogenase (NADP+)
MKIGILGLGLIGGSLGLDMRSHGATVIGVSRQASTCQKAITLGCVDTASTDLNLLADTEVVFICTPLGLIIPTMERLITILPANTVVTDVGSVKTPIVEAISPLWHNFVGGHPMAGTTESGVEAALPNLFVQKPYVLTLTPNTPNSAVVLVEELVQKLGAILYHCTPPEHDRAVSWISHLPVMVSAALISACMGEGEPQVLKLAQNLASSGFRDTSRVGGGNPELGVMMAKYNREALLKSLEVYRHNLDEFQDLIEQENWTDLAAKLVQNQAARPDFL